MLLDKGEEMGRFNMGSTVIVLCGRDTVSWDPALQAGASVRVGRKLGAIRRTSPILAGISG